MRATLALAGDTMLGRAVADQIRSDGPRSVVAAEVRDAVADADIVVLNLECCITERGQPWPDPQKPYFFRAPPIAVDTLSWLGVDAVTLANNHALDYGAEALLDTRRNLGSAGIAAVGAGADAAEARSPVVLRAGGMRVGVVGVTDHPKDFAAGEDRPGVAYANLGRKLPGWLGETLTRLRGEADVSVVLPHWGPNMVAEPLSRVRKAAKALQAAGASFVAGHSAHVFHGVEGPVCYDVGDFVDDFVVDPALRNDLGLLVFVTFDESGPTRLAALPLALDFCYTRPATGDDYTWVRDRFVAACRTFGTDVREDDGRLVIQWR